MTEATHWEIGAVKITCIVEVSWGFPPGILSTGLTAERVKKIEWLRPHYAGEDGTLFLNVQAFVLESQGKKIIVDTCIGNDKRRSNPSYNMLALPFLEQLKKAGHPVESIDYVLCTHLHIDHIGWNTRWDGKGWIPTFPNARYLFSRIDWEDLSHMVDRPEFADSLLPIAEAGLHQLVDANHIITEEISLFQLRDIHQATLPWPFGPKGKRQSLREIWPTAQFSLLIRKFAPISTLTGKWRWRLGRSLSMTTLIRTS
jgi:hypothetical protein